MKKNILTFGAVALLCATSCDKKETTKTDGASTEKSTEKDSTTTEGTTATNAEAPKTINGVEVPKFSNADTQKFADEYATFMGEMTKATKSGDVSKIQAFTAKSQEWAKKQAEMASKMTPEDTKLWTDFAMKLSQAQMPK